MRATTPQSPLGGTNFSELPLPFLKVGDVIDLSDFDENDWRFARKMILRHAILSQRVDYPKWGVSTRKRMEGKLNDHLKGLIRSIMRVVDTAHTIQVAGLKPSYSLNVGYPANQCYVGGVPGAASGVSFNAYLLFRSLVNGQELAVIPEVAIGLRRTKNKRR